MSLTDTTVPKTISDYFHDDTMELTDTDTFVSRLRTGTETAFASGELSDRLSRNDLFEMLSNERRRCVLYYLQQREGPVPLTDVVDYVTAWQYDQPLSQLDSRQRMCVYSALHQAHLPKLDAAGFIDYDTDNGTIAARDEIEYARLYLEYDPGNDISWSTLYAGLVGIGVVLGAASQLSVGPFGWLAGGTLVWFLLAIFGIATLAHAVHEWRNKLTVADLFDIDQ